MTIQAGTIGVNTASDTGDLLEVIIAWPDLLYCGLAAGGAGYTEYVPAADFWPLMTKLNTEG